MLADQEAAAGSAAGTISASAGWLHRILLRLDAERAHGLALAALRAAAAAPPARAWLRRRYRFEHVRLSQELLGTSFPNPVGLAAGFDKDAMATSGFESLGFGFVEVGTVTPRPQAGNPRPRLFRHPSQASLRNAMGFNNRGLEAMARRLGPATPRDCPLGVNIGRNKDTADDEAADDYRRVAERLSGRCDYFVVNVSSPNTPGLRDLQARDRLEGLLAAMRRATDTPFLVKLSPDLELSAAVDLAGAAVDMGATGLVLTNTTIDYSLLRGTPPTGGLSGRVLRERSFQVLEAVARELFGRCLLISVGGIESAEDVYRRLRHGASLVQLYTALAYRGPRLPSTLNQGLLHLLDRDGAKEVTEVIGADL